MLTECSTEQFEFARVEGHKVVANFDGGTITSDAGALLLGQTDQALRLSRSPCSLLLPIGGGLS